MAIITRASKGTALSQAEMDANLTQFAVTATLTKSSVGLGNVANTPDIDGDNLIINGAMLIDQRNAGAGVTVLATTGNTLDRWLAGASLDSKYSVQQVASVVAGFSKEQKVTSLSAYAVAVGDTFHLQQRIEGLNCAGLGWGAAGARSVTLSFSVTSSLTGTFGGSIRNGATTRSYPFSYSVPTAGVSTYITITIPGDTTGAWATDTGIGMLVSFGLGVGANLSSTAGAWVAGAFNSVTGAVSVVGTNAATFSITGVRLDRGSVAYPYNIRSYSHEFMLCQRYLPLIKSGTYVSSFASSTTNAYVPAPFPVTSRVAPTGISYGTLSGTCYSVVSGYALTSLAFNAGSTQGCLLNAGTSSGGLIAGQGGMVLFSTDILFTGCEL